MILPEALPRPVRLRFLQVRNLEEAVHRAAARLLERYPEELDPAAKLRAELPVITSAGSRTNR